jgi:TolA-binding protein
MNPGQTGGGWSVSRSGLNILSGSRVNDYYKCVDCGNEIKAAIDEMRTGAAPAATAAPAPQQPVQNDTSRLDALQKEVNELRQKFEAQRQTGNIDPNDTVMLQFATQQLSVEMLRNHRPGSALMGAARTELTPEDNARLDALQDEITALRHKVDVQMKQGVDARQDTERLTALTQQLSREGMRIQGFGMGMMGAAAGMQQPAPQPTPDPAPTPAPAAGSQTTCPVCGATTKVGAAGICEYCGSKIV